MLNSLLDRVKLQVCIRNLIKVYGYAVAMEVIESAIQIETRLEQQQLDRERAIN